MSKSRTVREQVISGFQISGWILLIFFTMLLLIGGARVAFTDGKLLEYSNVRVAKVVASVALAVGITITVVTVQRWANILPGLLFLASLKGLVIIFSGHLLNLPRIQVPRSVSVPLTLLMGASCVVSMHFQGKRLSVSDRIALLSFVGCFVWATLTTEQVLPMSVGFGALAAGWGIGRGGVRSRIR